MMVEVMKHKKDISILAMLEDEAIVGKHTDLTDKHTGTETKEQTFTDVVKKVKLPWGLLNKGPVEQLK